MAADCAPGLTREYFGFLGWKQHQAGVWEGLRVEAQRRKQEGLSTLPTIQGMDCNREAIHAALENADRAGLAGHVHFERADITRFKTVRRLDNTAGLVVANPPYGERLGEVHALTPLYQTLGKQLIEHFQGWSAAVLTANQPLSGRSGFDQRRSTNSLTAPSPANSACSTLHRANTDNDCRCQEPRRPIPANTA